MAGRKKLETKNKHILITIRNPEIYEEFKQTINAVYGTTYVHLGEELEAAMANHSMVLKKSIRPAKDTGKKNNFDAHLNDTVPQSKSKSKRANLQKALDTHSITNGMAIERTELINIISSAGYGSYYAAKEIAPMVTKEYNLDVLEEGMKRVYMPKLDRFESIPIGDMDKIDEFKRAVTYRHQLTD